MSKEDILVIRLGAMGDILHTLPAVTSLKQGLGTKRIAWLVANKWVPLLEGNPAIHQLVPLDRGGVGSVAAAWRRLRQLRPQMAIDFQGLVQSALAARASRPGTLIGFDRSVAREPLAAMLYTSTVHAAGPHRIQRNLQLAEAVGGKEWSGEVWLPQGVLEGELPSEPFVLASPFAGWGGKQWPLARYEALGAELERLGWTLVLNVPQERETELRELRHVRVHMSSLRGLIYATRQASAVVGVDSGPLHLAAALKKPGVAIFGQTDPLQTGPYQSPIAIIRRAGVESTYKRSGGVHASMAAVTPREVCEALLQSVAAASVRNAQVVRS